jgi:hypothetical protein
MIRSAIVALVVALLAVQVSAQTVKQVEVINFPTSDPPARYQLVGFTTGAYSGNIGGPWAAHAACASEFPDARMCRADEAFDTLTPPTTRPVFAWINMAPGDWEAANGKEVGDTVYFCNFWLSDANGGHGAALRLDGFITTNTTCDLEHPIACCAPVP